ncbi:MAG: hypothetical protein KJO20_02160 [Eudoraea sp.]|nr:hypothetical protein [Eudoraea sp.]NNK30833.1 hypothetical protein [Flavobacteriaceae bacterium]
MENSNLTYWLLLMAVGIIGFLIGFFLRGGSKKASGQQELVDLKRKSESLEKELNSCREKLSEAATTNSNGVKAGVFDFKAAKAVFGKTIKQDDLKVIEGIGPKIEGLFHNYDIKTWDALAHIPVSKCQEVLESGGDRYRVHDPSSWPMQAMMCHEGKWKELYRWQQEHKHGKL